MVLLRSALYRQIASLAAKELCDDAQFRNP